MKKIWILIILGYLICFYQVCIAKFIELKPNDETSGFGCAFDISGDFAIVGACDDDIKAQDAGAAYIFKKENERWTQQVKLMADDGGYNEHFGKEVQIFDKYAVIWRYRISSNKPNNIYIYKNNNSYWSFVQKIDGIYNISFSDDYFILGSVLYKYINSKFEYLYHIRINNYKYGYISKDNIVIVLQGGRTKDFYKLIDDQLITKNRINKDGSILLNGSYSMISNYDQDDHFIYKWDEESDQWIISSRFKSQKNGPSVISEGYAYHHDTVYKNIKDSWISTTSFKITNKIDNTYSSYVAIDNSLLINRNYIVDLSEIILIQGKIKTLQNEGIPNVKIEIDTNNQDGLNTNTKIEYTALLSDVSGNYSAYVFSGWSGSINIIPGNTYSISKQYTNLTNNLYDQDYLLVLINGQIKNKFDKGVPNVNVKINKGEDEGFNTQSDENGFYKAYAFSGWSGTISLSAEKANPEQRQYFKIYEDILNQDFYLPQYNISGTIEDQTHKPIRDVIITINSNDENKKISSNHNGKYSFYINPGWTGTIDFTKLGHNNFIPSRFSFSKVLQDYHERNVTIKRYSISGYIYDDQRKTLPNVKLNFTNNGEIALTNSIGYYNHTLSNNWSGQIIPEKKGYQFSPATLTIDKVNDHLIDNIFTGSRLSISGFIYSNDNGNLIPIKGMKVQLSNVKYIESDETGYYMFDIDYDWTGNIKTYKLGTLFEPEARYYTRITRSFCDQNFIANTSKYIISGKVTDTNNNPIPNIAFHYTDQISYTDNKGFYKISVDYLWSGDVIPVKPGYHFIPQKRSYIELIEPQINQVFKGSQTKVNIVGKVQYLNGLPMKNIQVTIGDQHTQTDNSGIFNTSVYYGFNGKIKPERIGYRFDPEYYEYHNLNKDLINLDFKAHLITFSISGTVVYKSNITLSNIPILFNNGGGFVETNANGFYKKTLPFGWSGKSFLQGEDIQYTPINYSYIIVDQDITDQNFILNKAPTISVIKPDWSINEQDFEHQGTITSIVLDSEKNPLEYNENLLAAFSNNECRGIAKPVNISNGKRYFLQIWSNLNNEKISFRFYDALTQNIYDLKENIVFYPSFSEGNIEKPFEFNVNTDSTLPVKDVNDDNIIDIKDVLILLQFITGINK